ncbi:MAG: guanylate kinase [Desulfovibrionaceae bacterium]
MIDKRLGIVFAVCAPSGTGKTTLVRRLMAEFPRLSFSVSYTTRAPRPGEVDGKDYHFTDQPAFLQLRDDGFFAEWAEVHGNYYGTPLQATLDMQAKGSDVLFDIDVQGVKQLRQTLEHGAFVFILPPSRKALEERLVGRGMDTPETIARRMRNAKGEIAEAGLFNAFVVNDDLDLAYDHLRSVYLAKTLEPRFHPTLVSTLLTDWEG